MDASFVIGSHYGHQSFDEPTFKVPQCCYRLLVFLSYVSSPVHDEEDFFLQVAKGI
jgi:hypothetical protein